MNQVPPHFLGMDVLWPGQRRELGTTIYYKCPFRSSTWDNKLTGKEDFREKSDYIYTANVYRELQVLHREIR